VFRSLSSWKKGRGKKEAIPPVPAFPLQEAGKALYDFDPTEEEKAVPMLKFEKDARITNIVSLDCIRPCIK
jgi:hypothetical protein